MSDFLQQQIQHIKNLIVAHQEACQSALSSGIQSYELDTGQSKQKVVRFNIRESQSVINSLMNQLSVLEARYCRSGRLYARPLC